MSIAFLFPGHGSQRRGMLHRLPDTTASATVLAEADLALRNAGAGPGAGRGPGAGGGSGSGDGPVLDLSGGIAELDTAEALEKSPVALHLALLIAGVAGARAMAEDEGVPPGLVVGHGVGAFAAGVTCGVLTFEEALRAVRLRGELLERGEEPGGILPIRLAQHLATVRRRPQTVPYLSGFYGRVLREDANAVFDDMARCAVGPPRWDESVAAMAAEGVDCCVEMPPGRALSERLAGGAPGIRAVSVEEWGIAEAGELARAVAGIADPSGAGEGMTEEDWGPDGPIPAGWGGTGAAGGANPDRPADAPGVPGVPGGPDSPGAPAGPGAPHHTGAPDNPR
ncbi:ACP S-malonyltransferase [Streptomyces sp. NPDC054796]